VHDRQVLVEPDDVEGEAHVRHPHALHGEFIEDEEHPVARWKGWFQP
jgi:hypothetical protein